MSDEDKTLMNVVRNFDAQFDDELTVASGAIVQFVSKLDRMWFKVYYDGREGKIPINTCQEWSASDMSKLTFDPNNGQAAFVSKFDFISDVQEGDLVFATNEILIGLYLTNESWWYGTRLKSVLWKDNKFVVKRENCGIFPITHVWMLRTDLLPKTVLSSIVNIDDSNCSVDSSDKISEQMQPQEGQDYQSSNFSSAKSSSEDYPGEDSISNQCEVSQITDESLNENIMFHVKVVKTMKAQLVEEMDLSEVGEVLAVISVPDKHYFYGSTLDGNKKGIFPKSFVKVLDDTGDTSSSDNSSPTLPPNIAPPPLPSTVGQLLASNLSPGIMDPISQEDPPSYEAAIKESPLYSGYSNQMLDEIESYGQVLYDFVAQQECELTVKANQIVRLIRHFDHEWLECEKDMQIGFVPKSYVKIIVDCEPSPPSATEKSDYSANNSANMEVEYPDDTFAEAIQDFAAQFDHDLSIKAGDRIKLLKHYTNTDWVQAEDDSGQVGLVPLTYLRSVERTQSPEPIQNVVPLPPLQNFASEGVDSVLAIKNSKFNKSHRSAPSVPREPSYVLPYPTLNQFAQSEKLASLQPESSSSPTPPASIVVPSTSQTDVKPPQTRASVTIQQRQCIITELIQTEKDYSSSISLFVAKFRHMYDIERPAGFDLSRITDDLDSVSKVSRNLLKLLEIHARDRAACDQKIGTCFLQLRREINDAYMRFGKNLDDLKQLIQTYKDHGELGAFMSRCEKRIQEETNCFDLFSIIIKPIQRILKYPLLLNELINCTEDDHIDKRELQSALEMITKTASDINELKRRQDLVEKYCKKPQDSTFGDKLGSLNRHSLLKKVGRIKNRVLSTFVTPLFEDKQYDEVVFKFRHVEAAIDKFVENLNKYLHHIKEYSLQILYVSNSFLEYLGRRRSDVEFWRDSHQECKKCFEDFLSNMDKNCVAVLRKLLHKFKNPNFLIQKREDKRLDYEQSLKSRVDNGRNNDLTESHFQALNIQLKEELPLLTELSLDILSFAMRALIICHRKLYTENASIFLRLHDDLPELKSIPIDYFQNIEQDFRVKHNILYEQMFKDFAILRISDSNQTEKVHRKGYVDPIRVVPASTKIGSLIDNNEAVQTEAQRRQLVGLYSEKDLFYVTSPIRGANVGELTVEAGDLIGVIKYKDPMGNSDRYFVNHGANRKGFLPKSILKPYQTYLFETQSTSLSSLKEAPISQSEYDQSHCYDQVPDENDGHNHYSSDTRSFISFDEMPDSFTNSATSIVSEFDPLNNAQKAPHETYFAAFDFKAQDCHQVSMKRGQPVRVKQKCDMNGNTEWWLVEDSSKATGYVPANYLTKR